METSPARSEKSSDFSVFLTDKGREKFSDDRNLLIT